jgi:hypothetical protein
LERIGLDLMLFHNFDVEFCCYLSSGSLGKTEDQKGSSSSGC